MMATNSRIGMKRSAAPHQVHAEHDARYDQAAM